MVMACVFKYLKRSGKRHPFGAATFKHKIVKCHIVFLFWGNGRESA
jgi:hypothetical protein